LDIVPKYSSNISVYIPIGNGCDNFCAYCVVPYARGREVWRPAEEIMDEVRELVKRGYKEITLIAQNVNSYKYNANPRMYANAANTNHANKNEDINFCSLLKMVNDIPGDFWVRFATSHPKDMSDELIKTVAECEKVCEHIHLPAQAGDDEILQKMNRGYTAAQYKKLIKKIRKAMPDAAITTDVIVGFPGETEEQFNNTVRLFEEVKFDMAYIAQYSPRPGTAAAKMNDNVPREEKKRREQVLTDVLRRTALENNQKYAGMVVEVLVEGKNRRGECMGRTRTAKNVKIQSRALGTNDKCEPGEFIKVKIFEAKDFGLAGEIVK
jgi:tRNA-2-methylthio-N6-dimethylallyladenosine synthase